MRSAHQSPAVCKIFHPLLDADGTRDLAYVFHARLFLQMRTAGVYPINLTGPSSSEPPDSNHKLPLKEMIEESKDYKNAARAHDDQPRSV